MRVLIVEPGNAPRQCELRRKLSSMQKVVGGTIQVLYPFEEPVALVCNDVRASCWACLPTGP